MAAVATTKSSKQKLDLYRAHAADYIARRDPAIVNIARCMYLAIDGSGTPGGAEFQACVNALYNVAFTIKMALKAGGQDYGVCKLEGLWPDTRTWSLLIRTPEFVGKEHLDAAVTRLIRKGKDVPVEAVRLLPLNEGWCVQALHVGPYSEEPATVQRMEACARDAGMEFYGTLHEIYLADPRRVEASRLKTILRQPVRDLG